MLHGNATLLTSQALKQRKSTLICGRFFKLMFIFLRAHGGELQINIV